MPLLVIASNSAKDQGASIIQDSCLAHLSLSQFVWSTITFWLVADESFATAAISPPLLHSESLSSTCTQPNAAPACQALQKLLCVMSGRQML